MFAQTTKTLYFCNVKLKNRDKKTGKQTFLKTFVNY